MTSCLDPNSSRPVDFWKDLDTIEKTNMKEFFKSVFVILLASSAFYIGFMLGKEKVMSQIPDFQEDIEGID